jgi:hypothetical protein
MAQPKDGGAEGALQQPRLLGVLDPCIETLGGPLPKQYVDFPEYFAIRSQTFNSERPGHLGLAGKTPQGGPELLAPPPRPLSDIW